MVVVPKAVLPDRCVKCNAPAEAYKRRISMSWHSPMAYLFLLLGLLPYIIAALLMTKRLTVHVGVCPEHKRKRLLAEVWTTLTVLAGIGLLVAAITIDGAGVLALAGFAVLLAALVYGLVAVRIVTPKKIDKQFAWVKGVSPDFLAQLPDVGE